MLKRLRKESYICYLKRCIHYKLSRTFAKDFSFSGKSSTISANKEDSLSFCKVNTNFMSKEYTSSSCKDYTNYTDTQQDNTQAEYHTKHAFLFYLIVALSSFIVSFTIAFIRVILLDI